MSDLIRDQFLKLTGVYAGKSDEAFRDLMVNCDVQIKIVDQAYRYVVKEGLIPIEDLPTEKKRELYNQAKEWKPDGDKELLTTFCRVIWLRENILNTNS